MLSLTMELWLSSVRHHWSWSSVAPTSVGAAAGLYDAEVYGAGGVPYRYAPSVVAVAALGDLDVIERLRQVSEALLWSSVGGCGICGICTGTLSAVTSRERRSGVAGERVALLRRRLRIAGGGQRLGREVEPVVDPSLVQRF